MPVSEYLEKLRSLGENMRLLKFVAFSAISLLIGFVVPAFAVDVDLSTPESVVTSYLDGVARQDFETVVAASSAANMSEKIDLVAQIYRIGMLAPNMPAPATNPLFIGINKANFVAQIAFQVRFLAYGLMTSNEIIDGKQVQMDAAGAADFVSVVRADRLKNIEVLKVDIPKAKMANSEQHQLNLAKLAKIYGADESTDRVALISFEGLQFVVGFSLLRYGEDWTVMSQTSAIAGLSALGVPKKTTAQEYEAMLE